jgi:hypothetical protein
LAATDIRPRSGLGLTAAKQAPQEVHAMSLSSGSAASPADQPSSSAGSTPFGDPPPSDASELGGICSGRGQLLRAGITRRFVHELVPAPPQSMKANEDPVVAAVGQSVCGVDCRHVATVRGDPVAGRHHDRPSCPQTCLVEHRLGPRREATLVCGRRLEISLREVQRFGEGIEIGFLRSKTALCDQIGEAVAQA